MTPEQRYNRLITKIRKKAYWLSRRCPSLFDELCSEADIAFMLALNNSHRAKGSIDDYIYSCVVCDMKNLLRGEMRRRRWQIQGEQRTLAVIPARYRPSVWVDLSDDAKAVLRTLLDRGIEAGRSVLYMTLGWRRYWRCLDELRETILEG